MSLFRMFDRLRAPRNRAELVVLADEVRDHKRSLRRFPKVGTVSALHQFPDGRVRRVHVRRQAAPFLPSTPRLPDGRAGRWENGKVVPRKAITA